MWSVNITYLCMIMHNNLVFWYIFLRPLAIPSTAKSNYNSKCFIFPSRFRLTDTTHQTQHITNIWGEMIRNEILNLIFSLPGYGLSTKVKHSPCKSNQLSIPIILNLFIVRSLAFPATMEFWLHYRRGFWNYKFYFSLNSEVFHFQYFEVCSISTYLLRLHIRPMI